MTPSWFSLLTAVLLLSTCSAFAFIERMYTFQEVLNETTHILVGRLEKVDVKARIAVMAGERALKGPLEYKKVNFNIALGPGPHAQYMIDRIETGMPAILFYKRDGNNVASLLHAADCWFQFYNTDNPQNRDACWWRMSHVEIKMGRTFNGATADFIKLTEDVLAKRVPAPPPDPKVPAVDVNRPSLLAAKGSSKTNGFLRQIHLTLGPDNGVRGISFADANGDGLLDVFLCRLNASLLLVNQGGKFKEQARELGVAHGRRAGVWADFDGDGKPDLLGADFKLFRNGPTAFKDDSSLLPAPGKHAAQGAGWLDVNGDGWPDVLIANGDDGLRLFRNPGTGKDRFVDASQSAGLGPQGPGSVGGDYLVVFDANGDGRADFFFNSGAGLLALNNGAGKFRVVQDTGLGLVSPGYKRGLAVADYDNDGDMDVFVPGPEGGALFCNENNGRFANVTAQAGDLAKLKGPSFSGAWGDVNGDGAPDLFVCQTSGPGSLLLNDGNGVFSEVGRQVGLDALTPSYAAGFADLDQDGDLDLVINLKSEIVVAFNDMPRPAERRAVTVRLKARKGAVGAAVRVLGQDRCFVALREINGGASCGGQDANTLLFSLPPGEYKLYAALSDGRLARKDLVIQSTPPNNLVAFEEADFK